VALVMATDGGRAQNVADRIGEICAAEGVRLIAGVMGGSATHIVRALDAIPGRTALYCRQERVAVDACDGFARVTGEPAVVFTDAGPGAANATAGILNSWGDSVPVLFFAPIQDRFEVFGQRFTKELPVVDVFGPISKWSTKLVDPSQVEYVMRQAFGALRAARSGPVVIGLPRDLAKLPAAPGDYVPVRPPGRVGGDPALIEEAVDRIGRAANPYLYIGAGVRSAGGSAELVALAELLTLPVATTLNAKGVIPEGHPLSLGIGGFGRATYSTLHAEAATAEADLIVAIGCGFKRDATKGPAPDHAALIQVDVDPGSLNDRYPADLAILGDARAVLGQLLATARTRLPAERLAPRPDVLATLAERRRRWWELCEPILTSDARPIEPFRVTREFSRLVDHDRTIVLHDAGGTRGYICQHYEATNPTGFIGYGVQSAMGWALGAAMGAKVAAPDKLVVAFMGDEAFLEVGMDLETSIVCDTPILLVLLNNRQHSLEQLGTMTGGRGFNPTLGPVRWGGSRDLAGVARALGAHAEQVSEPDDIAPALERAIAVVEGGRTAVVEFITARTPHMLGSLFREGGADAGGE
jgi:thiamine pyrophosphate-dependent acetolactate synthase large subunit-like protein